MTLEDKVDRLVVDVGDIKVALKGYNGKKGLCDDVAEVRKDFYSFRRKILITFAFLAGSGSLGFGVVKILAG